MKKRLICCLIVLAMAVAVFAGCASSADFDNDTLVMVINNIESTMNTYKSSTASYDLPNEYQTYDAKGEEAVVYIKYTVTGSITLTNNGSTTKVNIPTTRENDVSYTLKATLVDSKGNKYTNDSGAAYEKSVSCTAAKGTTSGGGGGGTSSYPAGGGGTTIDSPYTVAQAVSEANKLASGAYSTDYYYVKGVVGTISFTGDATKSWSFEMKDAGGTDTLYGYYVYLASGMTTVETGDTVIIYGKLQNYQGNKPEITTKSTDNPLTTLVKNETKGLSGDIKSNGSSTGGGTTGGGTTDSGTGDGVTLTGNTLTIDFTKQGYTDQAAIENITKEGVTVAFSKGSNNNAPKWFNNGTSVRCYGGNTITISGKTIVKVVLTFGTEYDSNEITTNVQGFETDTWTGSTDNLVFTIGGTTGNRRITSMVITLA